MRKGFSGFVLIVSLAIAVGAVGNLTIPVRWDDVTDHGKGDTARAVAVNGSAAVAVSLLGAADGKQDISIKALDIATGAVKWDDRVPSGSSFGYVTIAGDTAFALCTTGTDQPFSSDLFLRAYRISRNFSSILEESIGLA